jgi:aminoglycoside 6-adenylyltransferase
MISTSEAYEQLTERFTKWAQTRPDIRLAFVVGSRARMEDHPADEWADLDIIICTTDPKRYLSTTEWVENIGKPWLTFLEDTGTGDLKERRVLFEGGLDVDFAIISWGVVRMLLWLLRIQSRFPRLLRLPLLQPLQHLLRGFNDLANRGIRVLLDKNGMSKYLVPATAEPLHPPARAEFLEVVNDFWYHAVWTAKHLRRGELWWAKSGCDVHLKWLLRRMMEWHTRAMKGQDYDTWMRGRFLEEWADPRALEELPRAFAHYDKDDVWHALFATMDLFRWLSVETAERLGYSYPTFGVERATELVKDLFSGED